MLSFECIKNEKSVYFLLTSANSTDFCDWSGCFGYMESAEALAPI